MTAWPGSEWVFDLGNTRLKCAPLGADGRIGAVQALGHDANDFVVQLDAVLLARGRIAFIASVASSDLTAAVRDALLVRFRCVSFARTQARLGALRIAYANPAKFGVDRFLALLAAHARDATRPQLVVGVGTALTIDLLDAAGVHHGGRIAPSPTLMRDALHRAATQLPIEGGDYAEFADDTADALASGCEGAALALVERSLGEGQARLGQRPRLLLHGGGAETLARHFAGAEFAPSLVLEGLAAWARTVQA